MTTFTINNKEYTHKELNLMWDFFTQDQWDSILSDIKDPEIVSTIQQYGGLVTNETNTKSI